MGSPSTHRIKSLEKFKDDLSRVKFSDISYNLIVSGFFTKSDFSEIVALPSKDQILQLVKLMETELQKLPSPKQDELWECFLRALFTDYPTLAFNIGIECDKKGQKDRNAPGRIRKEDIGQPTNFRHIASATGADTAEFNLMEFQEEESRRAMAEAPE
ncbi:unnamed protein product [Allacma fusca]|nr:unnamed protein product [Allacma fusca]